MPRSTIYQKEDCLFKTVDCTYSLYFEIRNCLSDYIGWLNNAGFNTPNTKIDFKNGQLIFQQDIIINKDEVQPIEVIKIISKLDFTRFGLDSNPGNFIKNKGVFFVDFFPFLIRKKEVLETQFDYSYEEAQRRYFTMENIVLFYIARLYKLNFKKAVITLKYSKDLILEHYQKLLPREKYRILSAIKLSKSRIDEYNSIYIDTKTKKTITFEEDQELKRLIMGIN